MDTKALFKIGYGLYILSSKDDTKDNACIINTVMQVSDNPLRVAFSVNKTNYTHDIIKKAKIANISVLSDKSNFNIFEHFGFQSGRTIEKFEDFKEAKRSKNGLLYITKDTNAYFSVSVEKEIDLGSHTLFIAKVDEAETSCDDSTVTYDFYHKNIKPKPQEQKKKGWICVICNYVYEGENLPPDYICPICKHPASDFKKL